MEDAAKQLTGQEEEKPLSILDEEFESAFNEDEPSGEPSKTPEEDSEKPEEKPDEKPAEEEAEKEEKDEKPPVESEEKKPDEPREEPGEKVDVEAELEKLRQSEREHKSAFDRKAGELSKAEARLKELEAELESFKKKSDTEVVDFDLPEDARNFIEDYPEAKTAIVGIAEHIARKVLGGIKTEEISNLNEELRIQGFERDLTFGVTDAESGEWIDGHPDAPKICRSKAFGDWMKSKGYGPDIPKVWIGRITEYKDELLKKAFASKPDDTERGSEMKKALSHSIPSGGVSSRAPAKKDKTYEEAFNED